MGIAAAFASPSRRALIGRADRVAGWLLASLSGARRARVGVAAGSRCASAGGVSGQRSVSAITLWRTIWLAPDVRPSGELLLHELRHVEQFEASAAFPILYLWESLRRGYVRNRFEVDARAYAATRVRHG